MSRLSERTKLELAPRLMDEVTSQDLLIIAHFDAIGGKIANAWAKKNRGHQNDLIQVAMTTITEVVNKYPKITLDEDSIHYMAKAVRNACMDYCLAIPAVHAPSTSTRRALKLGAPAITITNEFGDDRMVSAFDEEDVLLTLAHTEQEKFIIAQRLDGKTYQEIGDALGLTKARVHQITKSLEKRLWE